MGSRSPEELPNRGQPNSSQVRRDDQTGTIIQRRFYGADGRAIKDIDYDHDYEGVGVPHAHDWDWTQADVRQDARPLRPGE